MSKKRRIGAAGVCASAAWLACVAGVNPTAAQSTAPALADAPSVAAEPTIPDKAARFHAVLRRDAKPGLVFERFCDAWLEEATPASLEAFLRRQADGGDPADALILGFYYAREGRNVDALRVFRDTLEARPGQASAHYFKATIEAATLDFDTALADLEAAAGAEPADALAESIAKLRGQLLVRVGRPEEAADVWAALLEARPDDPAVYESLVFVQAQEGQFDAALATLDALIERTQDPQKRVARGLWRGDLLDQAGRQEAAREAYETQLAQVGAGDWLERQVLAQLEQTYRRERAVDAYAERLAALAERHPDRLLLLRRRAAVLGELGRSDDALAQWKTLLERSPGDAELRAAYADVLADAGKTDDAIAVVEALLSDRPDDGELRLRLAALYEKAERDDDAVSQVQRFLDDSDGSLSSALRAVRTLERLTLHDAAEAMARAYAEANPDEAGATESLAELLFRLGQEEEATAMWTAMAQAAGDAAGLLEPVRALRSRGLAEPAMAVLLERVEAFADEPEVLAALADTALRGGDAEAAAPWLVPWVSRLDDAETLGRAVDVARRVARNAAMDEALARELAALEPAERNVGQAWLLTSLYEQIGDSPAADGVLTGALEAHADDEQAARLLTLARVQTLRQRGAFGQAADALVALAERPGHARSAIVRDLIDLYARDLRVDDALAWTQRWKEISPGSLTPWLKEARLLIGEARDDEAVRVLEQATRRFPEDVSAASMLAEQYAADGRIRDAQRVFWGLFDNAESTASKLSWVQKLAELTRWDDEGVSVIAQLEERRDQDRTDVVPHLALAEVYRVLDRYEPRRAALLEAARVEPQNVDLLLTTATTEERAGDLDQAAATLRRAMPLDHSGRARARLASLYVVLDRLDAAAELMQGPARGKPDVDEALRFADALAAQGHWSAADDFLADLEGPAADDYRVHYLRGVALVEAERPDAATQRFLAVLRTDEERPGHTTAQTNPLVAFRGQFSDMLPPEAVEIIAQMNAGWRAQAHRNQHHISFGASGGPQRLVQLPLNLDDAHELAIAQLRYVAETAETGRVDAIRTAMQSAGVRLAGALLMLPTNPQAFGNGLPPELIEAHGEEPAVLAIAALLSIYGQATLEPELLEHAAELFHEDFPGTATMARLSLYSEALLTGDEAEANQTHWPPLAELLERLDEPSDMLVGALAQRLGMAQMMGANAIELPDEQRQIVTDRLFAWYRNMGTASGMRPWVLQMMLQVALDAEDWPRTVRLLEDETEAFRNAPAGGANPAARMFAAQGAAGTILPLSFPPAELSTVPGSVHQLFTGQNRFGMNAPLDPDALLPHLDAERTPLLKAIAAGLAGDEATLTATLAPRLEGDTPSLDAFLLQAAWHGQEGRPTEALSLLIRASYLPMKRTQRQAVDRATVAYAIDVGDNLDDDPRAAAQRAALRLRTGAATYEQRAEVIEALAALGLEEEAEKLEQRLANTPVATGRQSFVTAATPSATAADRIEQALGEQRRDDALRLAKREGEALAGQLLQGNAWVLRQEQANQLRRIVKAHDLLEELLATADPGDTNSARRWVTHGALLQVFERPERAAEAYRRSLDLRFDASAAAQLVLLQIDRGQPQAAADTLAQVPDRQAMALFQPLQNAVYNRIHEQPSFGLNMATAHVLWLEPLGPDALADLNLPWLSSVWWGLTQRQHFGDTLQPHLYSKQRWEEEIAGTDVDAEPEADASRDAEPDRFIRRAEAHDRLARALLAHPTYAADAAARLALTTRLRGQALEPFLDTLEAALTLEPKPTPFGGARHHSGYQPDIAPIRPADLVFTQLAVEHGQTDRLNALIATLEAAPRRRAEAQRLVGLRDLFTADGDALLDPAKALIRQARGQTGQATLSAVVDAWERAGRPDVPLGAVLLDAFERSPGHDGVALGAFVRYAAGVSEHHGKPRGAELLEALHTAYIGPPRRRADLIAQHYNASSWSSNSPTGKMRDFVQLMRETAADPALAFAALEQLTPYDASASTDGELRRAADALTESLTERFEGGDDPGAMLITLLEGSPLLADAERFRSFPIDNFGPHASLFERLTDFKQLINDDDAERAAAAKAAFDQTTAWLQAQPDTLGKALTLAALRDDDYAATLDALEPHTAAIQQLDDAQKKQVLAALPAQEEQPEALSPAAAELAQLLDAVKTFGLDAQVQQILDLRRLDPHGGHWETSRKVGRLALQLNEAGETDRALGMLGHWGKLVTQQQRSQGWSNANDAEETLGFALQRGDQEQNHGQALALILAAAHEPAIGIRVHGNLPYALDRGVRQLDDDTPPTQGDTPEGVRQMLGLIDRLDASLPRDRSAAVLLHATTEAAQRHLKNQDAYDATLEQLAETDADASPTDLRTTARAAVRAARLLDDGNPDALDPDEARDARRAQDQAALRRYLTAVMRDEALPPQTRLGIARHILHKLNRHAPAVPATMRLVVHTLRSDADAVTARETDVLLEHAHRAERAAPSDPNADEAWPSDAEIVDAYLSVASRVQRNRQGGLQVNAPAPYRIEGSNPSATVAPRSGLLALRLALENDLEPPVTRLLRLNGGALAKSPATWALLAKHGKIDLVQAGIRQRFADAVPTQVTGIAYDQALHDAIPAVLDAIARTDAEAPADPTPERTAALQLFAEAALASAADETTEAEDRPWPDRSARLLALAERFLSQTPEPPGLRRATLRLLASDDHAAAALETPLRTAAEAFSLADTVGNHGNQHDAAQLAFAALIGPLRRGDAQPLFEQVEAVDAKLQTSRNAGWDVYQLRNQLKDLVWRQLKSPAGHQAPPDALLARWEAGRDLWGRLLDAPEGMPNRRLDHRDLARLYALHAIAPDAAPDSYQQRYEAFPESLRDRRRTPNVWMAAEELRWMLDQLDAEPDQRFTQTMRLLDGPLNKSNGAVVENLVYELEVLPPETLAAHHVAIGDALDLFGRIGVASALARGDLPEADAYFETVIDEAFGTGFGEANKDHRCMLLDRLLRHEYHHRAKTLAEAWRPEDADLQERVLKIFERHSDATPPDFDATPQPTPEAA